MKPSTTNDHRGAQAPVLEARDLTKAFGGVQALDRVSISIPEGQSNGASG